MTPSSFTCALHATHRRQPHRRDDDCGAGTIWHRHAAEQAQLLGSTYDQPSSAGATAALPGCGRDMDVMDPARCDCAQPIGGYLSGARTSSTDHSG